MLELAARAAAVLDTAGELAPDRGGYSSRTRLLGAGGLQGLLAGATSKHMRNGIWTVFERRHKALWGDLRFYPDTRLDNDPRTHDTGFRLTLPRERSGDDLLERATSLICDLFVAVGGFYGRADTVAMRTRRLNYRTEAADRGAMWIPRWNDPTFVIWDRWVEDVWWINLFGRAYVERWGLESVERMGARSRRLANGGVAVWSSDTPPDPQAARTISGYPHKQRFYQALGLATFIHESLEIPQPGARVPTLREHAGASV